jgi:hypothetical protein
LYAYLEVATQKPILMCDECNSAWYEGEEISLATEKSNVIFGSNFERGPTRLEFKNYFLFLESPVK